MSPFPPSRSLQSLTTPLSDISALLKSCNRHDHLKQIHARILTLGLLPNPSLVAAATISYLSLSLLDAAALLFRAIPTPTSFLRNSIIRTSVAHGKFHRALRLYSDLLTRGLRPDKFSVPFALNSCAALSDLSRGRQVHQHSISGGCTHDLYVDAALVDMYAKCGDVETARLVFDRMSERDLVSWTSMISGYAHNGYSSETIQLFRVMQHSGIRPNRVGLLSSLLACGRLGALKKGECFHNYAIRTGFELDIRVATAVTDMYAKCGSLDLAGLVFDSMPYKDVVCWSAMIACYGYHGLGRDAVSVFDRMVKDGVDPNHATFTCLLSACSHSGLLEEGKMYFGLMSGTYGVEPKLNHYACMVDLLGRSGKLHEAQELIEQMHMEPDASLWGSLLGACRMHGDLDLGEKVADRILELDPMRSGYYVLLSNIYAIKSRWSDVERVRKLMAGRKVTKVQGFSLIEFNNEIHKFGVGDRSHPQSDTIYSYLEELSPALKQLGYVPLMDLALHDVEDEMKEVSLSYHSERLAIAFGMINTSPDSPIRITKNLRICEDCHNAVKFISIIMKRVIIVRDMNRFHRFETGSCTCGDFW